jgi:hypothetical protein
VDEEKAQKILNSLCPSWMVSVVSLVGKSWGILVAWNPIIFYLQPFLCVGGILLTGIHIPDNSIIFFINVYGPCSGCKIFWEKVEAKGILSMDSLILAGDLNFTTRSNEFWGPGALLDPLAGFFKELFANNHLVDIHPTELVATWNSGRSEGQGIQKRLDRVFSSESILGDSTRYRSWVELSFISDHAPIIFLMDYGLKKIAYPFKFNL